MTVSSAIGHLVSMGQFIDASLFFNEGLEVLERMPDTPKRKRQEIGACKIFNESLLAVCDTILSSPQNCCHGIGGRG